jgi:hypothetical protein
MALFSFSPSQLLGGGLSALLFISGCQPSHTESQDVQPPTPTPAPTPAPKVTQVVPEISAASATGFYAYYTRLKAKAAWEDQQFVGEYPDIVVNLAKDKQLHFWRGSSYLPLWQTSEGSSFMTQLFNTKGDGAGLRWDKLNRHSHVRIIKQTATEVIVHWRYAPVFDVTNNPMTPGWTGWVDEYYYIKADGDLRREVYDHNKNEKVISRLKLAANGSIEAIDSARSAYSPNAPAFNSNSELPSGEDGAFGAQYTKLGYSGTWDLGPSDDYQPQSPNWNDNWQTHDHPDVVVNFDNNSTKWVFWRGLGFVPSMVSENKAWYTNEFNETWGWPQMCDQGGAEPMNDKQARYSHVRIIENTQARVVVHWRYHPTGVCYNLIDTKGSPDGWGTTSDFIFYIYPDGSTLSKNTLYSQQANTYGGSVNGFEYHEAIVINSAGRHPWDNIELTDSVTLLNVQGGSASYDGENGAINSIGDEPFPLPLKANISRINLKDTAFDTYTIMEHGGSLEILPYFEQDFSQHYPEHHFVRWDHWPVNQIRAFGRGADTAKYPSHTSLFHMAFNPPYAQSSHSQTRLLLTGLSDLDNPSIVNLANSWLSPAKMTALSGASQGQYDPSQRAYVLTATNKDIHFTLTASKAQPLHNPAFVIADWQYDENADIWVNGHIVSNAKQAVIRNSKGSRSLILFLPLQSSDAVTVRILKP